VNPGSTVNLVVSSGPAAPAQVAVPVVNGLTQGAAQTAITGAGLVVGTITQQANAAAAGTVLSSTPAQGTLVNVGSTVSLLVSSGPAAQIPAGLVAGFNFDADTTTATTATNRVANGNGAITGAVLVPGRAGFGTALSFDGVNDIVTVADIAALDLTTGVTIEAWVNPSALNGWDTIALKGGNNGVMSYGLYAHDGAPQAGGAAVPAGYIRDGGDRRVGGVQALPIGVWSHVAMTYDSQNIRLFINGVQVASVGRNNAIQPGNGALGIGGNTVFPGEFFAGLLDDVRIYNRALSAGEITTDMNTPLR
jgi:hypothetical protein